MHGELPETGVSLEHRHQQLHHKPRISTPCAIVLYLNNKRFAGTVRFLLLHPRGRGGRAACLFEVWSGHTAARKAAVWARKGTEAALYLSERETTAY